MNNIIAIVGRPNVGKSTLFNRLTSSRKAIVDKISGVTRDRHYGTVDWSGKTFSIIDTGGYIKNSEDIFEEGIRKQVALAIDEASVILFVVDVVTGITDLDELMASILRKSNKPVIVIANKVDNNNRRPEASVFYSFGYENVMNISAINGSGTGDMLDKLLELMPEEDPEQTEQHKDLPQIAVVGRPNVGKSSLINVMLGKERNIVNPKAGTTRDAISTYYSAYGFEFNLVDTAGLRKRAKVHEDLEFYSVMRSVRAIENSDVCIVMIDVNEGIQAQDLNIIYLVKKNSKGLVLALNKWDTIEDKSQKKIKEILEYVKYKLAPFNDVPILFVSVKEKQRVLKIFHEAIQVFKNRTNTISTHKLNTIMLPLIESHSPPSIKGKYVRIKFCKQLPTHSPAFAFYCNLPQYVRESYKRYLENQLREQFNFKGVPLKIFMRKK